ncbi:MAG: hypothetical protein ACO3QQ_03040 [Candidatus Nanopelagicaceae bacterium]|jgi:hypothetical protein
MKKTTSKDTIKIISRLADIRSAKAEMAKEEETIKDAIRNIMGDETALQAGDFIVLIAEVMRTDLDKKALAAELGDKLKQFEKQSSHDRIEIRRA